MGVLARQQRRWKKPAPVPCPNCGELKDPYVSVVRDGVKGCAKCIRPSDEVLKKATAMIVRRLSEQLQRKFGVRFEQFPPDWQWLLFSRYLGSEKSDEELLQEWRAYETRARSTTEGSSNEPS